LRFVCPVEAVADKACTLAGGIFFFHRADNDNAQIVLPRPLRANGCHSHGEGCQRAFGVNAAATKENRTSFALFNAHRDIASHGVNMPEQHQGVAGILCTDFANCTARAIHKGALIAE
jgi:hypothetical protein